MYVGLALIHSSSLPIPESCSPTDSGVSGDRSPPAAQSIRYHRIITAVRDGHIPHALKLLDSYGTGASAAMNTPIDDSNNTLLHLACASGDTHLVLALVKRGANVNARNSYGSTALHRAASHGDPKVAAILLQHGAEPNVVDEDGDTPLTSAVSLRHVAVVQQLLASHAEPAFCQLNVRAAS